MKKFFTPLFSLSLVLSLTACGQTGNNGLVNGKTIEGCIEMNDAENQFVNDWFDSNSAGSANDVFPENFEMKHFSSVTQMLLELDSGRVSMIDLPLCTAKYVCAANPKYNYVASDGNEYFKMAVSDDNEKLRDRLNSALAEIKADGTLAELTSMYISDVTTEPEKNALEHLDDVETVQVGITGDFPPFDYVTADGTPAGFNVALLNALSEKMNVNFKLVSIESNARVTALASDAIDIIFWMMVYADDSVTAYPDGKLLFTDSYFETVDTVVTKDFPIERVKTMFGLD